MPRAACSYAVTGEKLRDNSANELINQIDGTVLSITAEFASIVLRQTLISRTLASLQVRVFCYP